MNRLVPLALLVAVAGCGSSSSSTQPQRPDQAAFVKFQDCLKKQGVDFTPRPRNGGGQPPTGQPPADGRPPQRPQLSAKQQKALQACSKYRPQFNGQGGPPPGGGYGGPPPSQSQ